MYNPINTVYRLMEPMSLPVAYLQSTAVKYIVRFIKLITTPYIYSLQCRIFTYM